MWECERFDEKRLRLFESFEFYFHLQFGHFYAAIKCTNLSFIRFLLQFEMNSQSSQIDWQWNNNMIFHCDSGFCGILTRFFRMNNKCKTMKHWVNAITTLRVYLCNSCRCCHFHCSHTDDVHYSMCEHFFVIWHLFDLEGSKSMQVIFHFMWYEFSRSTQTIASGALSSPVIHSKHVCECAFQATYLCFAMSVLILPFPFCQLLWSERVPMWTTSFRSLAGVSMRMLRVFAVLPFDTLRLRFDSVCIAILLMSLIRLLGIPTWIWFCQWESLSFAQYSMQ